MSKAKATPPAKTRTRTKRGCRNLADIRDRAGLRKAASTIVEAVASGQLVGNTASQVLRALELAERGLPPQEQRVVHIQVDCSADQIGAAKR